MSNNFEDPEIIFSRRFKRVFQEIEYLERKIYKKEGWIFKNHVHSKEELLNSEHHRKIYSVTEKIGDDAENWYGRGNLSETGKALYYEYREETDDKLHEVNLKIEDREPTWWESMKGSLEGFVVWIMENMPDLKRFLLTAGNTLAKLPGPIGKIGSSLLTSLNHILKKLPGNERKILKHDQ